MTKNPYTTVFSSVISSGLSIAGSVAGSVAGEPPLSPESRTPPRSPESLLNSDMGSPHGSPPCPRPKSPPELYGKRRELAKVVMLEREIGFLQEELKSIETLQPASCCIKEVADYVVANPEPLITMSKKTRKSCGFWKWLCGNSCFSMSWVCCCCYCCGLVKSPNCCSCSLPKCSCGFRPSCPKCLKACFGLFINYLRDFLLSMNSLFMLISILDPFVHIYS